MTELLGQMTVLSVVIVRGDLIILAGTGNDSTTPGLG